MTTPKNEPKVGAKRGKVKGQAQVAPVKREALAPRVKPGEGPREYEAAFQAGFTASQRGTPGRPPLGYSDAEVKAWYAGYKSHSNPNAEGKVDDIEQGYRKDY